MTAPLDIAIVGLAGVYPRAPDAATFWHNICAKVDAISEADPEWVGPYFEADTQADDRIYTTRGGFLRELAHVDPLEVGVMPNVAAGSDPDHLIALKVAREALRDAGYRDRRIDGTRAGVVIARGTYGNRGLASMLARGYFMDQMMDVIRQLRPDFSAADIRALQTDLKQQLPPYGGDMVGVLTPNVIASLIANRLDFMGPAYIVDAACASSLIAVDAAVQELASGRCDLMLAGGTHVQTPPQLFIQFCQINALSRDRLRPFQKGAEGTLLGEGCGMLVLKRLADAERDGDRIYAVIKGVGVSSDGKAKGLLAPRLEGEVLAMQRAYASSGIDPRTVDLIEAHGTGTSVGDATEIQSLDAVFGARGHGPRIAISAVKSMIGHCLPGTGAASMIKTALALHHKVLPPMLCDEPDPALGLERTPFYINNQTRPWVHGGDTPRRAGVNAFGFGGINAHVILEEHVPSAPRESRAWAPGLRPPTSSELVLLGAQTHAQLVGLVRAVLAHLRAPQPPSLAEVARAAAALSADAAHRLSVVVDSAADLERKLEQALEKLAAPGARAFRTRGGVAYGHGPAPGKLCVLFPGEGSQYPGMLAELCLHFPQVRDWFDFIEESAHRRGGRSRAEVLFPAPTLLDDSRRAELEQALYDMDMAAESVFAASLGLQALYDDLGLVPDAMLGHSTGENTALTANRVRRYQHREEVAEAVQAVNALYRKLEGEGRIAHGSLLTVGGLTREMRTQLLASLSARGLQLAMDNCPNQVVLFGTPQATARAREQLAAEGAICQELPFGRAYHTPLFKPLADAFRAYFRSLDFGPGRVPLYSARHAAPFPEAPDAIRELAAQQWENPVRFTDTVRRLYADGFRIFLEIGPSANLTAFVADTLREHGDVLALSSNARRKPALAHLQQTLGQLYVAGVRFDTTRLYAHRDIAALDLYADPRPAKPARPRSAVSMPVVRLPEKWCRPLPAASAPASAASAPTPISPAAAPPVEAPRDAALRTHFELMQAFLDSQARMLGLMTGTAPAAAPVAAAPVASPAPDAEHYPMLGSVVESTPQRLVIERRYDLDTDLIIRDHCIGGTPSERDASLRAIPVIPFTFSMELIAQAAHKLHGAADWVVSEVENARGSRWLSFDRGAVQLRVVAERLSHDAQHARVACRVFRLDLNRDGGGPAGGLLVFEGQVLLAPAYPAAPEPAGWQSPDAQPAHLTPDARLYANGLFHGPRLQGCRHLRRWGERSIEVDLVALPTADYFAFTQRPRFQFDAALLDAAGQTACYWLDEAQGGGINCFPFRVGRLRVFAPPPPAGSAVLCRGDVQITGEAQLSARWDLLTPEGRLLMVAEGWDDRLFRIDARFHRFRLDPPREFIGERWLDGQLPPGLCARRVAPFPNDLLSEGGGIWGRGLAHMLLGAAERAQFEALPATGPRREEWLLGRAAAKEAARDWFAYKHQATLASADIEVLNDVHGRPLLRCAALGAVAMPSVSISHSQGWAAAVVAEPGLSIGLDYQRLDRLQADDALLRGGFTADEQQRLEALAAPARGAVTAALWCAKEAAAKAAGRGFEGRPLDWQVAAFALDPQTVSFGSARIRHGACEYDVAIQFENRQAVSALCVAVQSPAAVPG